MALLDGGLRAWRDEKRAIETGAAKPATAGQFTPRLERGSASRRAQQIQQQMSNNSIALVDVRPDPEFLGTDGGMGGMHAPGHIAGAKATDLERAGRTPTDVSSPAISCRQRAQWRRRDQ